MKSGRIYARLQAQLAPSLVTAGRLLEKPRLRIPEERQLCTALKEIAVATAEGLQDHANRPRPSFRSIQSAVRDHEKKFGHPPGEIVRLQNGRFRPKYCCVDIARGIYAVLETQVKPERLGVVRLNGPIEIHPSITVRAANGKKYVVDNWGMERRVGADDWDRFHSSLARSNSRWQGRYFGLADALGFGMYHDPDAAMNHPEAFIHGGLDLLHASAYENQANAHLDAGQDREALRLAGRALRLAPESDNAAFIKGNIFAYRRRFPEALRWYEEALRLNPNHSLALENMADVHLERKDETGLAAVRERLKPMVRFDPKARQAMRKLEAFLNEAYPDRWDE